MRKLLLTMLFGAVFLLTSCAVVPPNQPPVTVLKASPTSGNAPLAVSFDISSSYDPDGTIVRFTLEFGDGTESITGTDITKPISHTYNSAGTFTATLTVTDDDGATGTDSVQITVTAPPLPNRPPTCNDIDVTTDEDVPVEIDLATYCTDPDGDPLTGSFLSDPPHGTAQFLNLAIRYTPDPNYYGMDTFQFRVTDGQVESNTATVNVTVIGINDSPSVTLTSPSDGSTFTQGEAIAFQGSANDPEDGVLTGASLVWNSSIDGQIGRGESFTRSDLSVGTHTITLTATDSQGATGTASVEITVTAPPVPTCTVTLSPGQSIQEAIDQASPGDVICLTEGRWKENLVIEKSLTLRSLEPEKVATIGFTGTDRPIILVEGGEVVLKWLKLTEAWRWCIQWPKICAMGLSVWGSSQVTVTDSEISLIEGFGIEVGDSAQLTITNSTVGMWNAHGLRTWDSARVTIQNSKIVGNDFHGIRMRGSSQVTIIDSKISVNGASGIDVFNSARLTVEGSLIEKNGTDYPYISFLCSSPSRFCNGLSVWHAAQVELRNTTIRNNVDWGIAAVLKKCGYDGDYFTGKVIFEGNNVIEGNNTSGNQNGMGNPGTHPFTGLPDGQVCLP